jgi:3'-phosphoadenosine 5'-phosphosulfate (PAPS) 3'-phosphatase
LREEIGRFVAKRRGCCLSEASFTPFRYKPHDFSKKNAALTFWFFCVKAKEQKKEQIKQQICFLNSIYKQ